MNSLDFNIVNNPVTAIWEFDKASGLYTVSLLEKGGPIIQNESLEEAKKEFESALGMVQAIRNLHYFDDLSTIMYERSRRKVSDHANINYIELEAA